MLSYASPTQLSRSGFITIAPWRHAGAAAAHTPTLPYLFLAGGISFFLFLLLVVYFAQMKTLASFEDFLRDQKKEYVRVRDENIRLSGEFRVKTSIENLEHASKVFSMERAQAKFLDVTAPVFVAK